jgi:ABC-type transporter Mla MlaB component
MSKEETSSGLLSKVVKFVRNPATNWSDLDNKEIDRDDALSKQLLKEMIERKRRNDFVRKREFDMLRKMRKREAMAGQDLTGRPSFFQSSMPSRPDDRANTLKKIDEIEAQMSMQWWKTKGGSAPDSLNSSALYPPSRSPYAGRPVPARPGMSVQQPPAVYDRTEPAQLQSLTQLAEIRKAAEQREAGSVPALTTPAAAAFPVAGTMTSVPLSQPGARSARSGGDQASSGFSSSRMMAVDVAEIAHDAELEEAAIRFANGDDAGAEAGLLEMLAPESTRSREPETWMALFDLYRATAQHDKFEVAAIQFVQLFDRSAPQWFSMPDIVSQLVAPAAKVSGNGPAVDWVCPSTVGTQTIAALNAALAKAPMPWRLDWNNLKSVDPVAVEPLRKIFSNWAAQPVQLRFIGQEHLHQLLHRATPSGQRDTAHEWWKLRMEALRVMHRADEFELAALDFCVTYEVSPPAWENARCEYKSLDDDEGATGGHIFVGEAYRDSVMSGHSMLDGDTQMEGNSNMGNIVSVELSGQVQGDAIAVLDQLDAKLSGADVMFISCAKLIRVDFSAAGTLLNWVSARQTENRGVQFSDVNRLVAAFFNVIGITEHARVLTRVD